MGNANKWVHTDQMTFEVVIFVCPSFGCRAYEELNGYVIVRTRPQVMYATYLSAGVFYLTCSYHHMLLTDIGSDWLLLMLCGKNVTTLFKVC